MKDKYGIEVNPGDECIICKYNKVYKVKIYKLADWTVQYLLYDGTDYIKRKPIDYSMRHDNKNDFLVKIC